MEKAAVVVVACELGLEGSLVLERGGSSSELCLEVLRLGTTSKGCRSVQLAHAIIEVDLLAVVVDKRFLLHIGLVAQVGVRVGALFVGHFAIEVRLSTSRKLSGKRSGGMGGEERGHVVWRSGSASACGISIVSAESNFEGFRLDELCLSYLGITSPLSQLCTITRAQHESLHPNVTSY